MDIILILVHCVCVFPFCVCCVLDILCMNLKEINKSISLETLSVQQNRCDCVKIHILFFYKVIITLKCRFRVASTIYCCQLLSFSSFVVKIQLFHCLFKNKYHLLLWRTFFYILTQKDDIWLCFLFFTFSYKKKLRMTVN